MELSVADRILAGEADGDFESVYDAIKQRQKVLARRLASSLNPGDKVRVLANITPKTLHGLTGTVVSVGKTRIQVQTDADVPAQGRSRRVPQGEYGFPPQCLEVIDG